MLDFLPAPLKYTITLRLFGLFKVPMLFWLRPRVKELNAERCEIVFPLIRRAKNHLNSMYFGALCAGADCAGGMFAVQCIEKSEKRIDFVFKDFKADFKKRATGAVHFICEDGPMISKLVESTANSSERQEATVTIRAYVPEVDPEVVVADFELTISMKNRG